MRKPDILLLDESTSALDGVTEAAILQNLLALNITLVLATHRLQNLRNATAIFMLASGQIKESGTYDALVAMQGQYAQLAQLAEGNTL